jgi:type III restriction enzyme
MEKVQGCFSEPEDREAVRYIYHQSQGHAIATGLEPEKRRAFDVPLLAVRIQGQLELFEEGHFLDSPWNLAGCDASLSDAEFSTMATIGVAGELDVDDAGKIEIHFVEQLHDQLTLLAAEPGWTVASLVNWIDRQIPHPDIPQVQSSLFIHNAVTDLIDSREISVEQLARHKFRLRNAIEPKINEHRQLHQQRAYQRFLFGDSVQNIEVSPDLCFSFSEEKYSPNWYYEGAYTFQKHYFPLIGELKPEGEEFKCAVFLDDLSQVRSWVRNLERRPDSSFWLQTSTDRFYPDFVAMLNDERILVVEFKGEDRWSNDDSREKRAVGELWAERSGGRCLFIMPKGTDWSAIKAVVSN